MSSRLDRVLNWRTLAEEANYRPADMAERCHISVRQLERFFHIRFLMTPENWLVRLKLQEGLRLLRLGGSVKETASRLGYKQVSHFSREFKRAYGVSPNSTLFVGELLVSQLRAPPSSPVVAKSVHRRASHA